MKKILISLNLLVFTFFSVKGQTNLDWGLQTTIGINPGPAIFPGGSESVEFALRLGNSGGLGYDFSNDVLSNSYATIVFSFTKLNASAITPTGTGANLFTWVYTVNSAGNGGSWVGTTKNIHMNGFPTVYKFSWNNVPVTAAATVAETNIGVVGQFTDPTTSNVANNNGLLSNIDQTFTYSQNVLPVTLGNFSGSSNNCTTYLNWKTALEENSSHYDIEYSSVNNNFEKIGVVNSKNNSNGSTYNYEYNQPIGKGYYRLKMVDKDGTFKYSSSLMINNTCGKNTVNIYPNPTSDILNVNLSTTTNLTTVATLYDAYGKKVAIKLLVNGTNQLNVSKLAKGTYILRLQNNNEVINHKIIIK